MLTGHALVDLGLLAVAVVLLGADARRRGLRLTRSGMMLGGAVLSCVRYLWCPYWTITMPSEAAGRSVTLVGLVMLGVLWCGCFARRVEAHGCGAVASRGAACPDGGGAAHLMSALFAVMLALVLVGGGLSAPLEWRGDEDTHLVRLWTLMDSWAVMPAGWVLPEWCKQRVSFFGPWPRISDGIGTSVLWRAVGGFGSGNGEGPHMALLSW